MSDTTTQEQPSQTAVENPMEELRNEFREQFRVMKESFESQLNTLKTENETLKTQNNDLQRALVRSATVTETVVPDTPVQKTDEELYQERVQQIATLALSQVRI